MIQMAKAKYTKGKDGYWKTRVWDGTYDAVGRKRYITIRSRKSSKDLENKVIEHNRQIKDREYIIPSSISFWEYAVEWEKVYKASRAGNTRAMYQRIIHKYLSYLEDVELANISRIHYQTVLNSAIGHPCTQRQINLTFKQIIKSAVADQYLPANMVDIIFGNTEKISYKPEEKRALAEYEKKALFKAGLTGSDRTFVYILYGCGLRRGEALALTKEHVDLDKHTLTVKQAIAFEKGKPYIKGPKTQNGFRTVPIPDIVFATVRDHIKTLTQDKLFHMKDGGWVTKSSYRKMWERIIKHLQAETDERITGLTAHVFRHNYCTNLCYQIPSISIRRIAYLLGDTEKMVIEVYDHIILEKEDVSNALENALDL